MCSHSSRCSEGGAVWQGQRLAGRVGIQCLQDVVGASGLGQIIVGATVGGGDGSRNAAVAGQQDHPAKGEVLADRLNQVEAIIVAQVLVQNRAVQRGCLGR